MSLAQSMTIRKWGFVLEKYMCDDKLYYVYAHYKPTEAEPFYIGKGSGKRLLDKQHRSDWWINIVNKHGFVAKKLIENLSHEEALKKEAELIRQFGRRNINTGCLINLTDGMDGSAKLSEETKQKMSDAARGRRWSDEYKSMFSQIRKECHKKNPDKYRGRIYTEETRRKIGEKSMKKIYTEEYRKKLSIATSGKNNPNAQFYSINGMVFHTRKEVENHFKLCFATVKKRFEVIKLEKPI